MGDVEYYLTSETARRIAATVRRVEAIPTAKGRGGNQQFGPISGILFTVTTQIGAATDSLNPGNGAGTMLDFDRSTGKLSVSTFGNIAIWNCTDAAIIVGATVGCISMYGVWWYIITMCTSAGTGAGKNAASSDYGGILAAASSSSSGTGD